MNRVWSVLRWREFPVAFALVALIVVTYSVNPAFLAAQGVKDLMLNATILVILAAGQTLVLVTENVDLSIGSVLGLTAYSVGVLFAVFPGIPIIAVFIIAILLGGVLGAINGLLVSVAKVPALVITLGTLYIYRGINNAWAGGKQYFAGDRPEAFGDLSVHYRRDPADHPDRAVILAIVAIYLAGTRSGRDLYAIGSDSDAAKLYGVPVTKRIFFVFVANGLLAGLAGVLYASRFNSVGATTGDGIELQVVAAAVVGGVAISGGVGTVVGAALGGLLLTTITSSLTAMRVDKFWQQAVVGVLILSAVVIDRVSSLRTTRRLRVSEARNV